jgi:hypothetical protein
MEHYNGNKMRMHFKATLLSFDIYCIFWRNILLLTPEIRNAGSLSAWSNTLSFSIGTRARILFLEFLIVLTAKDEVKVILDNLPDDCSLEDVQYYLYVVEKIHKGIERAEREGTISQDEVDQNINCIMKERFRRPFEAQ